MRTERERQQEKDKAMTLDSEYSFVIWDCKSKGSYSNILRAIENNKKIKVYLSDGKKFMETNDITKTNIEFLYRKTNGYKAGEIVDYLKREGEDYFNNTQSLNKWLLERNIVKKHQKIYVPSGEYEDLFLVEKFRGRTTGIKFKNNFIGWIEDEIKDIKPPEQSSMF
jgi:hypothetical protein